MTDSKLFYAAACQTAFDCPNSQAEIADRTGRMCEIVQQTVEAYEPFFDVRLFVFPEFAHAAPIFNSVAELREHLGVRLPNEHTERYEAVARELNCFIQTGTFLEIDDDYPELIFNTTLLIGPTGVLLKYRKVNPWLPWEIHASPHDIADYPHDPFPVAETPLGRIGVAICYDWLFPETIRQLAFNGAEILLRVSAYMDPWGATPPTDWWTLFNRTRAIENTCYVVAANQAATLSQFPPFGWPGGSMVVDFDGRILAQAEAGSGEKVVLAPIDIRQLRDERKRRLGHNMRQHLRSEVHTYLNRPHLPPAAPADHPLTKETIERRLRKQSE
ncbi:MAG: nitrilase-related carbon-nitrogen hydrolase [Planctomycetota bacterium]